MEFQLSHRSIPPIFSTESIRTQFDDIGPRIEKVVSQIIEKINNKEIKTAKGFNKHELIQSLEKMIFDRFKLKVHVITHLASAAIIPFYSNKNHIFLHEMFRGNLNIKDQNKLLKEFDQKKGSVNLEKATVDGIFSQYDHPLYLNFHELVEKLNLSAPEITAAILHELGHAFYACYYSDRTDRTNQVLAGIIRYNASDEKGDIEYIYREISKISQSIQKEDIDKILNGPRTVASVSFFKIVTEVVKSQTVNDSYNESAFEQRADNFASRFGYGKQLVLTLEKIHADSFDKNLNKRIMVQIGYMLPTAIYFAAFAVSALSFSFLGVLGMILYGFFLNIFIQLPREDNRVFTYDDLKIRYLRIRQDIIDQLKEIKEDKEVVKQMLESIYLIDEAVKTTAILRVLPSVISNFIFSNARQTVKSINHQQLLEALASSDLFVKSAELRLKA